MAFEALGYVLNPRNPRDSRTWALANVIARGLPRLVVLAAAKRLVAETSRPADPIQALSLPVGVHTARWQGLE